MTLTAGQSLSFYEILGPLGAGGMGEVYRARDTRLEHEVAIKVLPEELADDEERLRRFEREAKTLASLNHPNVAGIHGVGQEGETYFLALELVPGEELQARISRGPIAIVEALDICRQIAGGLEAAHEAGVVHRDLKPANVHITPDGVVKVLDFGLAKPGVPGAGSGTSGSARPDSFLVTEDGLALGTPTYMSPEQARGKPVDRRTAIWAFGCVLYECLTGKRAFDGESLTDTLAAIVEHEVDWSALPRETPPHVRRLLERCLDKDPRGRLRDIGEARVALERGGERGAEPVAAAAGPSRLRGPVGWVGAALIGTLITFADLRPGASERDFAQPPAIRTLTFSGRDRMPSASPDGRSPLWSSDRSGAFEIWTARADGSAARQLSQDGLDAENPTAATGGDWAVYWSANPEKDGIWRVRGDGTEAERILPGPHRQSEVSGDGRWSGFLEIDWQTGIANLRVFEVETGRVLPLVIGLPRTGPVVYGRMRWVAAGALSESAAIAFISCVEEGRTGVFVQDFDPERDTSDTLRPLAGFDDELDTESFDIAPDGSRIMLSMVEMRRKLMLAEGGRGNSGSVGRGESAGTSADSTDSGEVAGVCPPMGEDQRRSRLSAAHASRRASAPRRSTRPCPDRSGEGADRPSPPRARRRAR